MSSNYNKEYIKENCFYKINTKSQKRKELLEFARSIDDWELDTKPSSENGKKSTFLIKQVPNILFKDDQILNSISEALKIKPNVFILKMPENIFYKFHADAWRGAAINMLLNDSISSHTIYNVGEFRPQQIHIEELKYETDYYYLLNTQIEHAVLNLETDRYMLTIGLGNGGWNREINDPNFYLEYKNALIKAGL